MLLILIVRGDKGHISTVCCLAVVLKHKMQQPARSPHPRARPNFRFSSDSTSQATPFYDPVLSSFKKHHRSVTETETTHCTADTAQLFMTQQRKSQVILVLLRRIREAIRGSLGAVRKISSQGGTASST